MRSINLLTTALAVSMLLAVSYISIQSNYDRYMSEPTQLGDIALSHEEAMDMCDDLGLVYDYEAEGYTTYDFCIRAELYNQQHEVDYE